MKEIDRYRLERWLRRAGPNPIAIVLGGSVNGLSFARSLGRRGVPVLMADSDRLIGTYTRYAETFLLPPADEDPAAWLDFFDDLGRRLPRPAVIFPTSDVHVQFLACHGDTLRGSFRFLVPEFETVQKILNKQVQYTVAESLGIPIPLTFFPREAEELESVSFRVSYPCILKPLTSHLGRKKLKKKVCVVRSPEELVTEYRKLSSPGSGGFMVQEILPGGDDTLFGYLGFWDEDEIGSAWVTKQKLRQSNPFGDGSFQVTVEAPEVADYSRRLLREFRYRGFVGVEFRFDHRDRKYRLIEVNPRTVSGNQIAISAGVDFPWIGYCYSSGSAGEFRTDGFRRGVRYVNEEWDLKAFLRLRRSGQLSFKEWLASLRGAEAWAIGSWDDPVPLLVLSGRLASASIRNASRALFRISK